MENKITLIFRSGVVILSSLGLISLIKYVYKKLKNKKKFMKDILDQMKETPLIYIKSLSELTGCEIYGKCEYMMPFTSKDRMIKNIILDAIK